MNAGKLDRRITIEAAVESRDEFGGATVTWQQTAEVWAEVKWLRGRELFAAQQVTPEAQLQFRIRWLDGLTTGMRIEHDGEHYGIEYIAELGRRDGLEITAKAVGNG